MTIILVQHETSLPALDGMIAAEVAVQRGARFTTLVGGGAGLSRFDCVQHVTARGELAPNGLLWAERAGLDPLPPVDRGAVARLEAETIVVPLNVAIEAHRDAAARIEVSALAVGRPVERREILEREGAFMARRPGMEAAVWYRDAFGRPCGARPASRPARVHGPVRILIVGDEALQREVYPANLAALGDAADTECLDLSVDIVDPRGREAEPWEPILAEVDGVLLPGGSDMEQVRGQTAIARAALRLDVPTLGLCLGMQTMCTAFAQEAAGIEDANLAEADPSARTKTFIRLRDASGRPEFRLGHRHCRILPGTRLAVLAGGASVMNVHCNHRFVLDPMLHAPLAAAGLRIGALHEDRDLADGIEVPAARFFMGMQGHPELASRPGRPHPLIAGFLAAAAQYGAKKQR